MAKAREVKDNHLVYADAVGSTNKSGVWFAERADFENRQRQVMDAVREKVEWLPIEGAIMAVSLDPAGIVLIAPNPSLPGVIVLADGSTPANTEALRARYVELVREATEQAGMLVEA